MTPEQALDVVVSCIQIVSGHEQSQVEQKLRDVGIVDDDRVDLLVGEIAGNRRVGVPSKNHKIDPNWLRAISPGSTVGSVADIVEEKSVQVEV